MRDENGGHASHLVGEVLNDVLKSVVAGGEAVDLGL
jgi:hypothetical protein